MTTQVDSTVAGLRAEIQRLREENRLQRAANDQLTAQLLLYRQAMHAAIERPGDANPLRAVLDLPLRAADEVVTLDDFQRGALRTWQKREQRDAVLNAVLGLTGEAGEVAELVKKALFHGKHVFSLEVLNEMGDVLYYLAVLAHEYGFPLSDVAQHNADKLRLRHPQGFDPAYHAEGAQGEARAQREAGQPRAVAQAVGMVAGGAVHFALQRDGVPDTRTLCGKAWKFEVAAHREQDECPTCLLLLRSSGKEGGHAG